MDVVPLVLVLMGVGAGSDGGKLGNVGAVGKVGNVGNVGDDGNVKVNPEDEPALCVELAPAGPAAPSGSLPPVHAWDCLQRQWSCRQQT